MVIMQMGLKGKRAVVTAGAFALHDARFASWAECRPRSFSVLPVAKACQARCAFCFSKASVSGWNSGRAEA